MSWWSRSEPNDWHCKTCGKPANQLYSGVGPCCSPELQEQNKRAAEYEKKRQELVWALQTRVLTEEEMAQVAARDYHLLVRDMVPYYETDMRRQFGEMLLLQFKLRAAANVVRPVHCPSCGVKL